MATAPLNALALVAWIAFTYFPLGFSGNHWRTYQKIRHRVWGTPPGWVFGLVWFVLYMLMSLAIWFFWRDTRVNGVWDAAWIIYVVNVFLNKIWTPIFFNARLMGLAALDAVLVLLTAIAVLVLFAVNGRWVSFVLYISYVVWLFYAVYLSIAFAVQQNKSASRAARRTVERRRREREEERNRRRARRQRMEETV